MKSYQQRRVKLDKLKHAYALKRRQPEFISHKEKQVLLASKQWQVNSYFHWY